jgi:CheY-like chemotaxis protein
LGNEGGKVRILVIDDDAVACEFLQEALLRAGYEVDAFTSAREALEEELSRYDMLLSDIRMPDNDGLQFLKQVHERWPHLPVILMTAFGSLRRRWRPRLGPGITSQPFAGGDPRDGQKVLEVRISSSTDPGQPEDQRSRFIGSPR